MASRAERGEDSLPAYTGKMLTIDLTSGGLTYTSIPEDVMRSFLGGSGLGAYILWHCVRPETGPLDPESLLMFLGGPLTGTAVPGSGRHSVIAKSPLTGIWGEASVGGTWGRELRRAGLDGIIVSGKAANPVYLWVCDSHVEIRSARHVWGMDTYTASQVLRAETDADAAVSVIGPAGEKLVVISGIFTDGAEGRAAARCGLGAVQGSKNLKAIVVRGSSRPPVVNRDRLLSSVKDVAPSIVKKAEALGVLGTPRLVIPCEEVGDLPIRNWLLGRWQEGARRISGQTMKETILTGRYHCAGCPIGCGRRVRVDSGPFAPVNGGGPEYETLGVLGSGCLVDNLEAVAYANELCNRYGLDTIEVGGAASFAMEAFERGLLSEKDADGVALRWGDPNALIYLVRSIGEARGLGKVLGGGLRAAAQAIGGQSCEFALHVKGMALPAHDPRAYNSLALGYATSNRGACHLQAFSHVFERSLALPDVGIFPQDRFSWEHKGELVARAQNLMSVLDSLCVCKFTLSGGVTPTMLAEWLNLVTGWDIDANELMRTGERIFNLKRMFNVRCGVSRKDDTLPARILTHKRGEGGAANNLPPLNLMLSDYYQYRGWSEFGVPLASTLADLGIKLNHAAFTLDGVL